MGRNTGTLNRPGVSDTELAERVNRAAYPLRSDDARRYDPLIEMIGNARIVLLGEASHGTHEFYRERALITRRLIEEKGFSVVAVEGDWPECYQVNQWVKGGPGSARDALSAFKVYPTWMCGNVDVLHFLEWLRRYNDGLPSDRRTVSFYGLDLYSVFASMEAVINYLQSVDPEAAQVARQRYGCFEPFSGDKDLYAYSAGLGIVQGCEAEAVAMLQELRRKRESYVQISPDDSYFYALMSAMVARDGERYYRAMYGGGADSWNLRDVHMTNTLDQLLEHFGPDTRVVVWEHNTHIGDFRATADADGMVNVGQLVRERHPGESVAVGFGTFEGSVTASSGWGEYPQFMKVPPAVPGSYDNVFHQGEASSFLLPLKPLRARGEADGLDEWRGQRAIGVVYNPRPERGNYVPTLLAERYDAYIHIDRTRAVQPTNLAFTQQESVPLWEAETYPTGY
jgi:erythromycin esterase-like protein